MTTNDGSPIWVMIEALEQPDRRADEQGEADCSPPRPAVRGPRRSAMVTAAHPGDVADREIDLAEEQDEHLAHPEQHEHRRLDEQVYEVARGQEVRVQRLEQDRDQEEPADDGQDPASPALIRATDERTYSLAEPATSSAGPQARPAGPRPRSAPRPESPAPVGSSTFDTLSSLRRSQRPRLPRRHAGGHQVDRDLAIHLGRRPDGDHAAEIEDGHAVGDLEDVVHVVGDDERRRAPCRPAGGQARAPSSSVRRRARPSARP